MTRDKQPVSVLVVIYTTAAPTSSGQARDMKILLLERADHPGYWQSVTGSREGDETLRDTAVREVFEETGLDAYLYQLTDWRKRNVYEIFPRWRHRYPPGVTKNTEHVFGLELPNILPVQIALQEHLNYQWMSWQDAADKVFSPSNRAAILELGTAGSGNRKHVDG